MRPRPNFHILLIIFVGAITYINVFPNQFLYDDEMLVVRNIYIRSLSNIGKIFTTSSQGGSFVNDNFYRPMHVFLYAAVYQLNGLNTFGYHLLNFLLHVANGALVYLLARRLSQHKWLPLTTALLWVAHPVHTEAVTYMNGTADPLSAFCGLTALLFYLRRTTPEFLASLFFLVLAFLSKETAVVFPALFLITDIYLGKTRFKERKVWSRYSSLAVVTGIYLALRFTVFNFSSINLHRQPNIYTENLIYRIYTFFAGLIDYYSILFWPADLKYDRAMVVYTSIANWRVALSIVIFLAWSAAAFKTFAKNRYVFFGWAWFFISLAPVSGIIPINGMVMEHWLYLPSIGFIFMIAALALKLVEKFKLRKTAAALLIITVISLSARALERNADWRDPLSFYPTILAHNPAQARVRNNLAMALSDKGRLDEAEAEYKQAIALADQYPQTHHNLALVYLAKGNREEAIEEFKKAVALDPSFPYSHAQLAKLYQEMGKSDLARQEEQKTEEILSRYR